MINIFLKNTMQREKRVKLSAENRTPNRKVCKSLKMCNLTPFYTSSQTVILI